MSLHRTDLPADPLDLFSTWLADARDAGLPYPTAMSLATASAAGQVSSRIVLLRYFDRRGFVFFSGYETKKAQQIAENSQVALLFPWLSLERQVKIAGTALTISKTESLRFFASRSKDSQLGAWLTQSSEVISSRAILQSQLEQLKRKFRAREVPLPDAWGGYRVAPHSIEFWQGNPEGLNDRFLYTRVHDHRWQIERLVP
jgi:pyridoxamine 5'-phosphate oxidase